MRPTDYTGVINGVCNSSRSTDDLWTAAFLLWKSFSYLSAVTGLLCAPLKRWDSESMVVSGHAPRAGYTFHQLALCTLLTQAAL